MEWTAAAIAEACGRPCGVRGVLVEGAGGGFGDEQGSSRGLSGPADLKWLLSHRALADALVVSYGTAIGEGYPTSWHARGEFAELRERLRLPLDLRVVVVSDSEERRASARSAGFEAASFQDLVAEVSARSHEAWVCEGGPRLVDRLAGAALLAELAWSTSPRPASGATPVPHLSEWRRLSRSLFSESVDGFVFDLSVPR